MVAAAVCVVEQPPLFYVVFLSPNTLSSPFLHRFSGNFATRRRFVGNRNRVLEIYLSAPQKTLGDKNPILGNIFSTTGQDFAISVRNAKTFYNIKKIAYTGRAKKVIP